MIYIQVAFKEHNGEGYKEDKLYTYSSDIALLLGDIVLVKVKEKVSKAKVMGFIQEEDINFPIELVKSIQGLYIEEQEAQPIEDMEDNSLI